MFAGQRRGTAGWEGLTVYRGRNARRGAGYRNALVLSSLGTLLAYSFHLPASIHTGLRTPMSRILHQLHPVHPSCPCPCPFHTHTYPHWSFVIHQKQPNPSHPQHTPAGLCPWPLPPITRSWQQTGPRYRGTWQEPLGAHGAAAAATTGSKLTARAEGAAAAAAVSGEESVRGAACEQCGWEAACSSCKGTSALILPSFCCVG